MKNLVAALASHIILSLTACMTVAGCSGADGSTESTNDSGRICEPGRQVSCACPDGTTASSQTCASDGMSWGACSCESAAATAVKCHKIGLSVATLAETDHGERPACGTVDVIGSDQSMIDVPLQYLYIGCSDGATELSSMTCAASAVPVYSGLGAYCCNR